MRLASEITRSPAFLPSVSMTWFFSNLLGCIRPADMDLRMEVIIAAR
jgi:hypothetical protein